MELYNIDIKMITELLEFNKISDGTLFQSFIETHIFQYYLNLANKEK